MTQKKELSRKSKLKYQPATKGAFAISPDGTKIAVSNGSDEIF